MNEEEKYRMSLKIIANIICFITSIIPLQLGIEVFKISFQNLTKVNGEIDRAFVIFIIILEVGALLVTIGLTIGLAVIAFALLKKKKEDKSNHKICEKILLAEKIIYIVLIIADIFLGRIKKSK